MSTPSPRWSSMSPRRSSRRGSVTCATARYGRRLPATSSPSSTRRPRPRWSAGWPELLDLIVGAPRVWVVDPLDGTQAFIDGSPDHAVMVGLIEYGEAVGGWICLPEHGETFVAQPAPGAVRDGQRLPPTTPPTDLAALRGGSRCPLRNAPEPRW